MNRVLLITSVSIQATATLMRMHNAVENHVSDDRRNRSIIRGKHCNSMQARIRGFPSRAPIHAGFTCSNADAACLHCAHGHHD